MAFATQITKETRIMKYVVGKSRTLIDRVSEQPPKINCIHFYSSVYVYITPITIHNWVHNTPRRRHYPFMYVSVACEMLKERSVCILQLHYIYSSTLKMKACTCHLQTP